jgi:hypothetical protein
VALGFRKPLSARDRSPGDIHFSTELIGECRLTRRRRGAETMGSVPAAHPWKPITMTERRASAPSKASNQSGGSPDQGNVTALYPEVTAFLLRERWGATRGESPVRSESELDSAKPVGENAGKCRTLVCTTAIPRSSVWISPWDRYRQLTLGAVTRRCQSQEMAMRWLETEWNEVSTR